MSRSGLRLSRRGLLRAALGGGLALAASPLLAACSLRSDLVRPAPGGWDFTVAGKRFTMYGMNWLDPDTGFWPPHEWSEFSPTRVDQQLGNIASIGVRTIRVFVAATYFQPTATSVNPEALKRMDTFLGIAERHGLSVLFTTPADWEGTPTYRQPDKFAGTPNLQALAYYWSVVGKTFGRDPRILGWDLHNEGTINWTSSAMAELWPQWLQQQYKTVSAVRQAWGTSVSWSGSTFESAPIPPDQSAPGSAFLWDYQRFREWIADRFLQNQLDALNEAGDHHMRTVGAIQWSVPLYLPSNQPSAYSGFSPVRVGKNLDFISIHFYPLYSHPPETSNADTWLTANILYLQAILAYIATGQGDAPRPVVLEEIGEPAGPHAVPFYQAFPKATVPWACGWMPWTYAIAPTAPTQAWGLFDDTTNTLTPSGQAYKADRTALREGRQIQPHAPVLPASARPSDEQVLTDPNPEWLWQFVAAQKLGTIPEGLSSVSG